MSDLNKPPVLFSPAEDIDKVRVYICVWWRGGGGEREVAFGISVFYRKNVPVRIGGPCFGERGWDGGGGDR